MTPKLHVDLNWLSRISGNLERFHRLSKKSWACRCNMCGDSAKHKRKTRLYFYIKDAKLKFKCHNCGLNGSFYSYIKSNFKAEFESYKKDTFEDFFRDARERDPVEGLAGLDTNIVASSKTFLGSVETTFVERAMIPILSLSEEHLARKYLVSRNFDNQAMERLFYTDDFKKIGMMINEESGSKLVPDEPRIVIPFYNEDGLITAIQGRSLNPKNVRMKYITLKVDPDGPKVYGLDNIDKGKTVYEVEGPLDSLFVDNCIACCDGNLGKNDISDVLIWDNQPRNIEVVNYIGQAIEQGRNVVIWPVSPNSKLDINDMIKGGISRTGLMKIIKENTYSGMKAKLLWMKWKKV